MQQKNFKANKSRRAQALVNLRWGSQGRESEQTFARNKGEMSLENSVDFADEIEPQHNHQQEYISTFFFRSSKYAMQINDKILTPNTYKRLPTISTYERQQREKKFAKYGNLGEENIVKNLFSLLNNVQHEQDEFQPDFGIDDQQFDDYDDINDPSYYPTSDKENHNIILQIHGLLNFISQLLIHFQRCQVIPYCNNIQMNGLYTEIIFICPKCYQNIILQNSTYSKHAKLQSQQTLNLQSILASLSVGLGFKLTKKFFAILGISYFSANSYKQLLNLFDTIITEKFDQSKEKNIQEEIRQAVNNNTIDQQADKPQLQVIGDCAWGCRAYNHAYVSKTGCAVLIGKHTQNIIYLDTKIKGYNWNGTNTGMESTLLRDGFAEIYRKGVVINEFIADADSNTYKCIKMSMPNRQLIKKIDCANHAARNFGTHLENWKKTFKNTRQRNTPKWRTDYMGLIRKLMGRAQEDPQYFAIHVKNSINHMTGEHGLCDQFYCTEPQKLPPLQFTENSLQVFNLYLNNFSARGDKISKEQTSNLAECYFSVLCRFLNGKCINLTNGCNYYLRTKVTGLCFNEEPQWNYNLLLELVRTRRKNKKFHIDEDDTREYVEYHEDFNIQDDNEIWENCYRFYYEKIIIDEQQAEQLFNATINQSDSEEWYTARQGRIISTNIYKVASLQDRTNRQKVVYQIAYPPDLSSNVAIQHGKLYEQAAINSLKLEQHLEVKKSGFIVRSDTPFLGASPDSLVFDKHTNLYKAVVEVKCPYNCKDFSQQQIDEDIKQDLQAKKKIKFLYYDKQKKAYKLKQRHTQVQCQMYVSKLEKAYFVVYFSKEKFSIVIELDYDKQLFENKVLQKIEDFYFQNYLPEIAESRKILSKLYFCFSQEFSQNTIIPAIHNLNQ